MPEYADEPMLSALFEEALIYASRHHARQLRKGTGVPYVVHLLSVAALALEHGADEETAIAALLHDAIEDRQSGVTADEVRRDIARMFGARVLGIVEGCTDADVEPKPPWRARKEAFLRALRDAAPEVRLVTAADKLHNARCLLRDYRTQGDALWRRFKAGQEETLWYLREAIQVLRDKGAGPDAGVGIIDELERTVAELERVAQRPPRDA